MTCGSPGEKRRRKAKRERELAAYALALAAVKSTGATCSTCANYIRAGDLKEHACDLDSDFHGYAIVKPHYVCPRYQNR